MTRHVATATSGSDPCEQEDDHDPWCMVRLADLEHLELAERPCDCGLRDGVRRTPALTPVSVCACSSGDLERN